MAQPSSSRSSPIEPLDSGEKASSTPRTTIRKLEDPKSASEGHEPTTSISGALQDLLCGAFLPCLPVVLVSTLLLTLILYHRVDLDPGWQLLQTPTSNNVSGISLLNHNLGPPGRGGHAAYYVRFNPAVLATIAAWSSKIIPYITGYLMTVIGFFAGRRILNASRNNEPGELPTPHQMSILIDLLGSASPKSLWSTIVYRWHNHERLFQPIPMAFGALSYIVIITLLIGAADTWFAATTKPMNVELLTRHTTSVNAFGRDFNSSMCSDNIWEQRPCPSNPQSLCSYPCSIGDWNITAGGGVSLKEGIKGAQQAAETLLGNSDINIIQNTSYVTDQQGYDTQQCYFLTDANIGQVLDFLANTTAVTTQCEVVTQNCQVNSTSEGFSCPGYQSPSLTFSGEVGVDPTASMGPGNMSTVGIQFFKDSGLQNPIGFGSQSTELFSAQNPVHFLTWSKGFPPVDTSTQTFAEMNEGKYLQIDQAGDNVFILNCSSTIYKSAYAWVNGTILQDKQKYGFYPELAPDTYGAIFSAPFAINSALGHLALQSAAALAAYNPSPQGLADKFADEFSQAAVALTAGIMSPETCILEQSRNNTELLTRVPLVPLYFLISLKALFALSSILVVVLAAFLTGPAEAQEVKARLTVDGLAAGLFEPHANQEKAVEEIKLLYGEHRPENREDETSKVGMKQAPAGGWIWVASGRKARTARGFGDVAETDNAAASGESGTAGKDYQVLKAII